MTTIRRLERRAPAKVNLGLAITGRRPDGYHELRSVFLRIGLSDRLEGSVLPGEDTDRLTVSGDPDCPTEDNIVLRAVRLLRSDSGDQLPALNLTLDKHIPLAAGLGGGSSDAAAGLTLAAGLWGTPLADGRRESLAARLGADVPFFVGDHAAALVTGIGEQLEPLPPVVGELGLLLVCPPEGLATGAVFAALDQLAAVSSSGRLVDDLAESFRRGMDATALSAMATRLRDANDLWTASIRLQPSLERLRSELEGALDRPFLLSGSGSTLFAVYPSLRDARHAGDQLVAMARHELIGARVFAAGTGLDITHDAWRIQ